MKRLKFQLGEEPINFEYDGKLYELKIVNVKDIKILNAFTIPANIAIRIRKTDPLNKENVTDYYVFRRFGKTSSSYFCLGSEDYIRFKYGLYDNNEIIVTLFPRHTDGIMDYALRISTKQSEDSYVSSFGIRSVNDSKNRGKINSRKLFSYDGNEFTLNLDSTQNQILYEFFEQAVSNLVNLMRYTYASAPLCDNRIIPNHITACTAKINDMRIPEQRKFFNSNYVNEFAKHQPTFLNELLEDKQEEYSMITLECRILGEIKLQRIDCYIFDGGEHRIHVINHQPGKIQFLHFQDYRYHVRYEADPLNDKSTIKVFERSREILKIETSYTASINNRLEGLSEATKQKIIAAMPAIH